MGLVLYLWVVGLLYVEFVWFVVGIEFVLVGFGCY